MTTNWDNCIERACEREHVSSIIIAEDLLHVAGRSVLKIHGCATKPNTLLLTSAHLHVPPTWVTDETRAKLGNAVVVFIGIGDVADYVKQRLEEAVADVGNVANIRVVSPGIVDDWAASEWSTLIPTLAGDHRIPATADEFLEKLGAAYVHMTLAGLAAELQAEATIGLAFGEAADGLRKQDALTVLAWTRRAGVVAKSGASVLSTESMAEALAALGKLTGGNFTITPDLILQTTKGPVEVLASVGIASATRLRREAQNRFEKYVAQGVPGPTFLVGGGIGWEAVDALPADVLAEGDATDVVDGPMHAQPEVVRASEVLAA